MKGQRKPVAMYPIGAVERATGLSKRQIRYYEDRGLISPRRTRGDRRIYSREDIERLAAIKRLLTAGLSLDGVQAVLDKPPPEATARSTPPPRLSAGNAGRLLEPENLTEPDQWFQQSPSPDSIFPVKDQARLERWLTRRRPEREP
ncbi:MAG: MerR family transcriptional regulator [Bacillota bacterium]